jgi:hypothetical protein
MPSELIVINEGNVETATKAYVVILVSLTRVFDADRNW